MKALSYLSVTALLSAACYATEPAHVVFVTHMDVGVVPPAQAPTHIVAAQMPAMPQMPRMPQAPATPEAPPSTPDHSGFLHGDVYALPVGTNHLPDFTTLTPVAALSTPDINVPARPFQAGFPGVVNRVEWFGVRYVGTFEAATTGAYNFRAVSDDGARLLVDGQTVLINDGTHAPTTALGTVYLASGTHRIVMEYFQGPRVQIALQLFWRRPGEETEQLFSVAEPPTVPDDPPCVFPPQDEMLDNP